MKKILFITLLAFSTLTIANDDSVDLLANLDISKSEVSKSLETLHKAGQISAADYEAAQKALGSMSDDQLNKIKETAIGVVKSNPDKALELVKSPKIDINEAQRHMNAITPSK